MQPRHLTAIRAVDDPHPSRVPGILRAELRKALGTNPWFWLSLAAGCVLAAGSAVRSNEIFQNTLEMALAFWNTSNGACYSATSCFGFWMPIDTHDLFPGVFVLTWPLLAAVPYAWSWGAERRRGVLQQELLRTSREACYLAKAVATFLSGALVVLVPYLANLVACACFAPASPVWASDQIYLGIVSDAPLSSLFYSHPLAFCLAWSAIASVVAGLWATTVLSLTLLVEHPAKTVVGSYVALYLAAFMGAELRVAIVGAVGRDQHLFDILRSAPLSLNLFSVVSPSTSVGGPAMLVIALSLLLSASIAVPRMCLGRDLP